MNKKILLTLFCCVAISSYSQFFNPFKKKTEPVQPPKPSFNDISKMADRAVDTLEQMTVEQEYYLGRAVASAILQKYPVLDNQDVNNYINYLGQALALYSEQPSIFNGYSFLVLDTDEINGFATPGGHIFVTKGLLKLADNEDEVAAILAHEISHVVLKHGVKSIEKSKITTFYEDVVEESVENLRETQVDKRVAILVESVQDITKAYIDSGYSRLYESEADRNTIKILNNAGYDTHGLTRIIYNMSLHPGSKTRKSGYYKTHPTSEERLSNLKRSTGVSGPGIKKETINRFNEFKSLLN